MAQLDSTFSQRNQLHFRSTNDCCAKSRFSIPRHDTPNFNTLLFFVTEVAGESASSIGNVEADDDAGDDA